MNEPSNQLRTYSKTSEEPSFCYLIPEEIKLLDSNFIDLKQRVNSAMALSPVSGMKEDI